MYILMILYLSYHVLGTVGDIFKYVHFYWVQNHV